MKDRARAPKKADRIFSRKKKKLIRVTKIGAVLAMSVAWATEVKLIAQFQTAMSVPKKIPASPKVRRFSLLK